MNPAVLAIPAALCYLASGLLTGLRLFSVVEQRFLPRRVVIGLGLFGVLLHALVIYQLTLNEAGLNLSFFNAMSLSAWIVALMLLASALTKPVENLGIVILPLAALALLVALKWPSVDLLSAEAAWGLKAHVLISLLAYSLLTMASIQAILLAIQDYKLHHHHPGGFVRALPPLQTMEVLLFEMIGAGFVLLTLALVSGFLYLENLFAQHLVHKTVLSIASWGVFGVLLWGRWRFGWRGRTAIRWTLVGFLVLVLAYFGSKAVLELVLDR